MYINADLQQRKHQAACDEVHLQSVKTTDLSAHRLWLTVIKMSAYEEKGYWRGALYKGM